MRTDNHHAILTDSQWRCALNAIDVLDEILAGNDLDPLVLRDLKDNFPPALINQTRERLDGSLLL